MPLEQDTAGKARCCAVTPRSLRPAGRLTVIILCSLALGVIVLSMTAGALRNHDQASYVAGALQIASWSTSKLQFYNYDKQYGTAWLLASALRLFPMADPILICNLVQVALAGIALAMLDFRLWRDLGFRYFYLYRFTAVPHLSSRYHFSARQPCPSPFWLRHLPLLPVGERRSREPRFVRWWRSLRLAGPTQYW